MFELMKRVLLRATLCIYNAKELSGAVVSRLDFCAGDTGSIPGGAEFPTGICSGWYHLIGYCFELYQPRLGAGEVKHLPRARLEISFRAFVDNPR